MRTLWFRESTLVRFCTFATALATLGAAQPEPSASEAPTPLKEIGRVRTSVCSTIVVHANSAIDAALSNDSDLHNLIVSLATTDMDGVTDLKRHFLYRDFEKAAAKLHMTALDGEAEVRRLRALAADSPEPRKTELKAFADALGGALARQRLMAVDAQRLLLVQQGRAEKAGDDALIASNVTARTGTAQFANPASSSAPTTVEQNNSVDKAFRSVAADFVEREKLVTIDEGVAADHSLGATTGC